MYARVALLRRSFVYPPPRYSPPLRLRPRAFLRRRYAAGGDGAPPPADNHTTYLEEMAELRAERDLLFTSDEVEAWSSGGGGLMSAGEMDLVNEFNGRRFEVGPPSSSSSSASAASSPTTATQAPSLSHIDPETSAFSMVSPSKKPTTHRWATSSCTITLPPSVSSLLSRTDYRTSKGSVVDVARLAGMQAAKKTSDLIPLCHQVPLDKVDVRITHPAPDTMRVECSVEATYRTGVEMESIVGCMVSAACVVDMVKGVSHEVVVGDVRVMEKGGGRRNVRGGRNVD